MENHVREKQIKMVYDHATMTTIYIEIYSVVKLEMKDLCRYDITLWHLGTILYLRECFNLN